MSSDFKNARNYSAIHPPLIWTWMSANFDGERGWKNPCSSTQIRLLPRPVMWPLCNCYVSRQVKPNAIVPSSGRLWYYKLFARRLNSYISEIKSYTIATQPPIATSFELDWYRLPSMDTKMKNPYPYYYNPRSSASSSAMIVQIVASLRFSSLACREMARTSFNYFGATEWLCYAIKDALVLPSATVWVAREFEWIWITCHIIAT